jgi:hypothetical protein
MSIRESISLPGATLWALAVASSSALADDVLDDPQGSIGPVSQEIGLTVSKYKYEESDFMSLKAVKVGVDYSVTFPFNGSWFVRGDARYANGKTDYESNGTGSSQDNPDWYAEWRLTVGHEFVFGSHTLAPYLGYGYRFLLSDLRGTSSSGAVGYRRESQYNYLPVGLRYSIAFGSASHLVTTLEYDRLIDGRQKTLLSDTEGYSGWITVGDVTNKQRHGYGVRFSSMFQTHGWSFGPYATYWKIRESEIASNESTHEAYPGYVIIRYWIEPENTTKEAGVKVSYMF